MKKKLVLAAVLIACAVAWEPRTPRVVPHPDGTFDVIFQDQSGVVYAQSADCFAGQTFIGVPAYFETLTISSTALPLTAATYKPTNGNPPSWMALMTVATDSIRVRFDGIVPTAAVGHLVAAGSTIVVCQAGLPKFNAIRVTTDASLTISYFAAPQ